MTTLHNEHQHASWVSGKLHRRSSEYSQPPPEYELNTLSPSTSTSTGSLPEYEHNADTGAFPSGSQARFYPSRTLQIEAAGHGICTLPYSTSRQPIRVYEVMSGGDAIGDLVYESERIKRHSGDSILVRAGGSEAPICSTNYRFGPGRHPRMRLHGLRESEEVYEFSNKSLLSRAQVIRTHLGTFEWRYASRKERKALGANSLLVLEHVSKVALAGGGSEDHRRKVAQLIRNDEYRSRGTSRMTAGNGGRLELDLREWADTKGEAEQMEVLALASCMVMLKKEVDRRRAGQMAAMHSGGGGP
ncbi:hypothetical protein VHEMI03817 [[Torrubiella] hemipterigena]|uniref:Uncharacterized protein n=1 Tax=[Torrubiella] hemipterigena TaxID=1531966 RepID=A0A0A1TCD1_9HYPO|nr:hypothetical protein VHEMI03817 [[Torrubiella] hemipterigena]